MKNRPFKAGKKHVPWRFSRLAAPRFFRDPGLLEKRILSVKTVIPSAGSGCLNPRNQPAIRSLKSSWSSKRIRGKSEFKVDLNLGEEDDCQSYEKDA